MLRFIILFPPTYPYSFCWNYLYSSAHFVCLNDLPIKGTRQSPIHHTGKGHTSISLTSMNMNYELHKSRDCDLVTIDENTYSCHCAISGYLGMIRTHKLEIMKSCSWFILLPPTYPMFLLKLYIRNYIFMSSFCLFDDLPVKGTRQTPQAGKGQL